jgi:hypothetical protein
MRELNAKIAEVLLLNIKSILTEISVTYPSHLSDFLNSIEAVDAIQPLINKEPELPRPKDDAELEAQNLALQYHVECTKEDIQLLAALLRNVPELTGYEITKGTYRLIVMLLWDTYAKSGNILDSLKKAFVLGMSFFDSVDWEDEEEE